MRDKTSVSVAIMLNTSRKLAPSTKCATATSTETMKSLSIHNAMRFWECRLMTECCLRLSHLGSFPISTRNILHQPRDITP